MRDFTSWGTFALAMGPGERKAPPAFPTSEAFLLSVEPLSDARMPLADGLSILLEKQKGRPPIGRRPVKLAGQALRLGTDADAILDHIKSFLRHHVLGH